MNSFSDLKIKEKTLSGNKISIFDILDKEIIVTDYRIEDSKYGKRDSKCLHLQIKIDEELRLIFTGSTVLMDILNKIPEVKFPFKTIIVKELDWYKFT